MLWDESDEKYWLEKENSVGIQLSVIPDDKIVVASMPYNKGWVDTPEIFGRTEAVKALIVANDSLPDGYKIKVVDGFRSWETQEKIAELFKNQIRNENPTWTEEQIINRLWVMAPPSRVIPRFASHRYGGAFDVTLCDSQNGVVDMGVKVGHTGEESTLFHYHLKTKPTDYEEKFRDNRSILIRAMQSAGFYPNPHEFWHWEYAVDIENAVRERQKGG